MAHPRVLDRSTSLLVVVDVQEGYDGKTVEHDRMQRGVCTLIEAANLFAIPIVATEQYPKGIGHLVETVRSLLPPETPIVEKLSMSCCGAAAFVDHLHRSGRKQIVVCGIEAHACVSQTVHDLLDLGYQPHVPYDALSSRFAHDYQVGWQKMVGSGAVPTSVEMTCLEWVRTAASAEFKPLHRLIK